MLNLHLWASLVAQWERNCLPMQKAWVWSLVWEDSTYCGATKPMCHNYWACALEPRNHKYWAHVLQLLKPRHPRACATQLESSPCSSQLKKSLHSNVDAAQPKTNKYVIFKKYFQSLLGWFHGYGAQGYRGPTIFPRDSQITIGRVSQRQQLCHFEIHLVII